MVATERGPGGGRLVALDEDGSRLGPVTNFDVGKIVDSHPSFSPDGSALVFASSRGRKLEESYLWLVPAKIGAKPIQLTRGPSVDRDPAWSRNEIFYSSNAKGSFDIWRLQMGRNANGFFPKGPPVQITSDEDDELAPSISPDGNSIVYMSKNGGNSSLKLLRLATKEVTALTQGPADFTPAWSPDGNVIAFSGPVKERNDTDIFFVDIAASGTDGDGTVERRGFVDEPLADQTAPVWSDDGKFVFATSVYRSLQNGAPILSSIVVSRVDSPKWRAVHDPTAVDSRWGIAVFGALRVRRLEKNLIYERALKRAIEQQLNQLGR